MIHYNTRTQKLKSPNGETLSLKERGRSKLRPGRETVIFDCILINSTTSLFYRTSGDRLHILGQHPGLSAPPAGAAPDLMSRLTHMLLQISSNITRMSEKKIKGWEKSLCTPRLEVLACCEGAAGRRVPTKAFCITLGAAWRRSCRNASAGRVCLQPARHLQNRVWRHLSLFPLAI